jgi:predicted extracellular nuclease
VVSADFDNSSTKGFFMQDADCDANPATSDGIFVYLGARTDIVNIGDMVQVSGTVEEYYGLTRINAPSSNISLLSQGNLLPAAIDLDPPFNNDQSRAYFESLEGMLVQLPAARVVGPTDNRADTWVIRSDLGLERVFQDDALGTGEIICVGAEGLYEIEPPAKVGDQIQDLVGVLDFSLGTYRIALLTQPILIAGGVPSSDIDNDPLAGFTFATFNFKNLFDWIDDPAKNDDVLTTTEYHDKLDKIALTLHDGLDEPAFIAVQEAENDIVLTHLLARPILEADYDFIWVDGPDTRGIDIALAYRTDQVSVLDFEQRQGCTSLGDGFGPDGDRDVGNPQNAITCDTDGDGVLDGNRLFSRPPLVVQLQVALGDGETLPLWVIVNHWKSKREDTHYQAYTLPRRLEQAKFVAALTDEILSANPGANLIVLGDLNDYPDSQPLARLAQSGLRNLMTDIPRPIRYTYIYQGVSQVLDYALISPALSIHQITPQPVHLNADFPTIYQDQSLTAYRSSDHDPVNLNLVFWLQQAYFPMVR